MNAIQIVENKQDNSITVRLIPQHQTYLTVPFYSGHDPFNRIFQKGALEYIEFDVINWDCTFKLVFETPDINGDYNGYFNFLVFASEETSKRITEIKELIDNILELLSNQDLQSMADCEFCLENSDSLFNLLINKK